METHCSNIAKLNDKFRKTWQDVVFTPGVMTSTKHHLGLAQAIESFSLFNEDNDPYGEHDFGSLVYEDQKVLWKIDYYDQTLSHWCDPLDSRCRRIMTVLLAEEY